MNSYTSQLILSFAALASFLLTFSAIPTILTVSYTKHLFAVPNNRNVHKTKIPTLGGLGIFIGLVFSYTLFTEWFHIPSLPFFVPAIFVIFAIGIKDDILVTAPLIKLIGQFFAVLIIVGLGDCIITDFHGFFGLVPNHLTSFLLTIFFILALINGFNLIDGIDGLAGVIALITTVTFSIWFYINGNLEIPLLGAVLSGALIAFLYFNLFTVKQKIFMGDTGSLIIGFLLAVIAVRFMEFNSVKQSVGHPFVMKSAPAVALGVLIIPIVDTIRVFFIRLSKGKSPFIADKNHIHHRILTLGFSHLHATLLIAGANIFFIILSFLLKDFGTIRLGILNLALGLLMAELPGLFIALKKRQMKKANRASSHNSGEQIGW